jgi:hypothetical protein
MTLQPRQHGNARAKRLRRGFEQDWNWYDEPVKKLLGGWAGFNTSRRINHRRKLLEQKLRDLESEIE